MVAEGRQDDVSRIAEALEAAMEVLRGYTPGNIASTRKAGGSPVTDADREVNHVLHKMLPRRGEGWLSEETVDDAGRLKVERVWIVDPLDGTHEFIDGVPEWCVSIGLVEGGVAVAGGIANPAAGRVVLGARGLGVTLNGEPVRHRQLASRATALVLASRSESGRGEWERFAGEDYTVQPMGSVAYKLGCVAAGLADATWTLTPKNEWDVAAGCALVTAAGGMAWTLRGSAPVFNRPNTLLDGLVTFSPGCLPWARQFAEEHLFLSKEDRVR